MILCDMVCMEVSTSSSWIHGLGILNYFMENFSLALKFLRKPEARMVIVHLINEVFFLSIIGEKWLVVNI